MQETRNSSSLAMELHHSCINPLIWNSILVHRNFQTWLLVWIGWQQWANKVAAILDQIQNQIFCSIKSLLSSTAFSIDLSWQPRPQALQCVWKFSLVGNAIFVCTCLCPESPGISLLHNGWVLWHEEMDQVFSEIMILGSLPFMSPSQCTVQ